MPRRSRWKRRLRRFLFSARFFCSLLAHYFREAHFYCYPLTTFALVPTAGSSFPQGSRRLPWKSRLGVCPGCGDGPKLLPTCVHFCQAALHYSKLRHPECATLSLPTTTGQFFQDINLLNKKNRELPNGGGGGGGAGVRDVFEEKRFSIGRRRRLRRR